MVAKSHVSMLLVHNQVMFEIRQSTIDDIPSIKAHLQSAYHRSNESIFFEYIRQSEAFIPALSLVAEKEQQIIGYILLTKIGIRTANEILPSLVVQPFSVAENNRNQGIGRSLLKASTRQALAQGFSSCVSLYCGNYFSRFGFRPARYEFGLETYFSISDEEFLAIELTENALYRRSGFLLFPNEFARIDPTLIS